MPLPPLSLRATSGALLLALAASATAFGSESVLDEALDSVQAERLSADLHFIASDEMRGRDTPSPELRVAARFIAARLERVAPGMLDDGLRQAAAAYVAAAAAMDGELR